jgi:hypothetical protein
MDATRLSTSLAGASAQELGDSMDVSSFGAIILQASALIKPGDFEK